MATDPTPHLLFPTCAECAGIGLGYMSELLWDMEDECGFDALKAFLLTHGGREFAINRRDSVQPSDPLLVRAYAWLRSTVHAGSIVVPKGPSARRARLAWTIFKMLEAEASLGQIAAATDCHMRTVGLHKARLQKIGALPNPTTTSTAKRIRP